MVKVKGKRVDVDDALGPLVAAITGVLAGSGASEVRQMAALLTVVSHRCDVMTATMRMDVPPLAELQQLIAFWLRLHRQIVAQEQLRVRTPLTEYAATALPGEEPDGER